jgi:CheY-like chemotaxis protein
MSLLLPTLFNCEIHAVDTGEEGIKAATDYLFNLILTDIDLPGISGIMVAKQIRRQSRSKNKDTPIIAISGNLGAKREGYKVGINAFLAKPFITSQALKKIIDFLL